MSGSGQRLPERSPNFRYALRSSPVTGSGARSSRSRFARADARRGWWIWIARAAPRFGHIASGLTDWWKKIFPKTPAVLAGGEEKDQDCRFFSARLLSTPDQAFCFYARNRQDTDLSDFDILFPLFVLNP